MKSKTQFVVLGAGYAGMTVAVHLDNKLSKKNFQVILVNINSYHELIQEAHPVAGGFRRSEQVRIPISDLIRDTGIQFIQSGANTFNFSSDEAVANIKCHLQEARNAADSALLQINEAEKTILASHNRSSDRVP